MLTANVSVFILESGVNATRDKKRRRGTIIYNTVDYLSTLITGLDWLHSKQNNHKILVVFINEMQKASAARKRGKNY